jgi:benzylsuccinate CoA-transferase BbsF subunit
MTAPLPLAGYRVLDFGWVMAGPILGHILADYGAEVIKVESRRRLDASRRGRPIGGPDTPAGDQGAEPDRIPLFHAINRNKRSVTIDITHPEAPALVKALVRQADVVVENFTPRVLRRYGLDYAALAAVKPDLVMISLSAAGQWGQLSEIAAYAPSVTSLAGLEALVGYPGERVLGMTGLNFSDPTVGLLGAFVVMAALYHRDRTGQGQHIDLSQVEAMTCLAAEALLEYELTGRVPGPPGATHPAMAPYGFYPCRGAPVEDEWVAIAVGNEAEWRAFCRALGEPAWTADPRFADRYRRVAHRTALDAAVAAWTRERTKEEAAEQLRAAGVAAAPVLNIAGQFADPHLQARGVYVDVEHPLVGTEIIYGLPWKLSDTPGAIRRAAPLLGADNTYVFQELLGLDAATVERLRAAGVIS